MRQGPSESLLRVFEPRTRLYGYRRPKFRGSRLRWVRTRVQRSVALRASEGRLERFASVRPRKRTASREMIVRVFADPVLCLLLPCSIYGASEKNVILSVRTTGQHVCVACQMPGAVPEREKPNVKVRDKTARFGVLFRRAGAEKALHYGFGYAGAGATTVSGMLR